MRNLILAICTVSLLGQSFSNTQLEIPLQDKVYICDSSGAKKYHLKKDCRGLNACKHKIIKVTKAEAFRMGKKELCGWED